MEVSVQVENITKTFAKSGVVLDSVSLDIRHGEFLSLLGPSGSGKTTFLRILSGLETADSGRVHFCSARTPGDAAFVFQEPALVPWLSVEDNIRLPCQLLRVSLSEDEIDRIIRLVRLHNARRHLPRELSGGMKMRVSLARALVTRPRFLLLDEPFAALDEVTRLELEEELSTITQLFEMTTVLVTHAITEAVFLSDRVYVLSGTSGRIDQTYFIDQRRPRADAFRSTSEFARWVSAIRGQFGRMGGRQ